jgi:hypothetical protein
MDAKKSFRSSFTTMGALKCGEALSTIEVPGRNAVAYGDGVSTPRMLALIHDWARRIFAFGDEIKRRPPDFLGISKRV